MQKVIVVTLVMEDSFKKTVVETVIFTDLESEETALGEVIASKLNNKKLLSYSTASIKAGLENEKLMTEMAEEIDRLKEELTLGWESMEKSFV